MFTVLTNLILNFFFFLNTKNIICIFCYLYSRQQRRLLPCDPQRRTPLLPLPTSITTQALDEKQRRPCVIDD
ncbi:hypothetical protein PUN28_013951 [Cardiocondyla obscurior]|uniref:Secreted protein n=1 Tax=Cardiocondyla obscurior TaxID=286306 RepID=A0AAW2F5E9_9HYME